VALGVPWCGRLAGGVALPEAGLNHFTWDLTVDSPPNPVWRRYGTIRLVALVRSVVAAHRRGYPRAGRVGIADLSLPRGGPFGPLYGGLGHLSHQNGRDVDVLYPRRDGVEAAPQFRFQVDRMASQDLVDRFVAAGVQYVFVGQGLGLRGPPGVVQAIPNHLDHMHVRITPVRPGRAPARCPWQPE
jgi:murein endopeptidase